MPQNLHKQQHFRVLGLMSGTSLDGLDLCLVNFSWNDTWSAQSKAGIQYDTTLMFNDRYGFRSSSALEWQPWNEEKMKEHELMVLPTVLMDSHLYDYNIMTNAEQYIAMEAIISEWQSFQAEGKQLDDVTLVTVYF